MSASAQGKPLVIVYHADCIDGAASAWAIAKAWDVEGTSSKNNNVTYVPYDHSKESEGEEHIRTAISAGAEVYFVDVAPEKDFLDELMSPKKHGLPEVKAIHIYDHHKTANEMLNNYEAPAANGGAPTLDMHIRPNKSSAAKMIWEHVLPNEKAPEVLDLIDKMDGNAAGLKTPEDFSAAAFVDSHNIHTTKSAFDTLRGLAKLTFNQMAKNGEAITAYQNNNLEHLLNNTMFATMQVLPGEKPVDVTIVNGDVHNFSRNVSESLVDFAKKNGASVSFAWCVEETGVVTMSIRSNGNPDASKIAEYMRDPVNGVTAGGHPTASAVHFPNIFEFSRRMPVQGMQKKEKSLNANPVQPPPKMADMPIYPKHAW